MLSALLIFFIAFVIADVYLVAAVFYHLRQYTLPGWDAARVIMPLYIFLSLALLLLAVYYFRQIPVDSLELLKLKLPF